MRAGPGEVAGLAAEGFTEVLRIHHLDRGYDDMVGKLRGVGAQVARISEAVHDKSAMAAAVGAAA